MSAMAGHIPKALMLMAAAAVLLAGCAATPQPGAQMPEGDFRQRIQIQEQSGVRLSAAVPSASEARELFGKPLYKKGIQPVWLKIENNRDELVTFLPVGLDPNYFSPLEVANLGRGGGDAPELLVDQFFIDQSISLLIPPGEELSGFVFTRLDEGTKAFNVDLAADSGFRTFTFFIPVPGLNIDHYSVDWENLYPEDQWVEPEKERLIAEIESYVCCVTDKNGKNTGDPLNLILIGKPGDIYTAFIRAGWDETEAISASSLWKTAKSFMSGGEYRYSPISSLYVFGRPQDIAFQKARENIHERNHLRLWMSRVTYQGLPVWIGQISRDIGVRFTTKTITTHKIDPNVDETREYLLENLAYAQSLKAMGYVGGVGRVPRDAPRGNLTGDPWFTDGYRLVLWVSSKPEPISEIGLLDWRHPSVVHGSGE
jgi:hypothetical protein